MLFSFLGFFLLGYYSGYIGNNRHRTLALVCCAVLFLLALVFGVLSGFTDTFWLSAIIFAITATLHFLARSGE